MFYLNLKKQMKNTTQHPLRQKWTVQIDNAWIIFLAKMGKTSMDNYQQVLDGLILV